MKEAMREKNAARLSVLRLLIAEVRNESFSTGKKRSEEEVVFAYLKRLTKAKEEFGDRDAVFKEKLNFEISVVEEFLPKLLTEEELRSKIKELELSGTPISLKTVMPVFKGKADAKMLQGIILNWS